MSARSHFWADWTWRDFAAADMARYVAVLPIAAVEQHGPHLPVGTDAYINDGHLARVMAQTPADWPALYLPALAFGHSQEHDDYPGSLSLAPDTLLHLLIDIGESVARAGCRKLIILNSHGGNVPLIDLAALRLRRERAMMVVHAGWRRLGLPEGLYCDRERAYGIHGGDYETSLMLAFRPETVRMSEARNFASAAEIMETPRLKITRPIGMGWMASDLNPEGVVGDASNADAKTGETSAAHATQAFLDLLADVIAFDLAHLKPGPLAK